MASSPKKEKAARKRGANYTEAEKENLKFLAKRHNHILESKSTGTNIFQQKADAWTQLAKSYNASSTSGIRTAEQLKHLYENMKQNARKALATSNKADYLHMLEEEKTKRADVQESLYKYDEDEDTPDLEALKFLDKSDKIERKKTGGGCFTPGIKDKDLKVLELIKDQVQPLSNPYDSAASYFKDILTQKQPVRETATEATIESLSDIEENMVVVEIIEDSTKCEKPKGPIKKNTKYRTQKRNIKETQCRTGMVSASMKKTNFYKNAYFKKKYENSILERRRLYQDIRLRQKEHLLITKKLKLEIAILEKQK